MRTGAELAMLVNSLALRIEEMTLRRRSEVEPVHHGTVLEAAV